MKKGLAILTILMVGTNSFAIGFCSKIFEPSSKIEFSEFTKEGFNPVEKHEILTGFLKNGKPIKLVHQSGTYYFKAEESHDLLGGQTSGVLSRASIGFKKIEQQDIVIIERDTILRFSNGIAVELPAKDYSPLVIDEAISKRKGELKPLALKTLKRISQFLERTSGGEISAIAASSIRDVKVFEDLGNENMFFVFGSGLIYKLNIKTKSLETLKALPSFDQSFTIELKGNKLLRLSKDKQFYVIEKSNRKEISEAREEPEIMGLATRIKSEQEKAMDFIKSHALNFKDKKAFYEKLQDELHVKVQIHSKEDWKKALVFPMKKVGEYILWINAEAFHINESKRTITSVDQSSIGFQSSGIVQRYELKSNVVFELNDLSFSIKSNYQRGSIAKVDFGKTPRDLRDFIKEYESEIEHLLLENSLSLSSLNTLVVQKAFDPKKSIDFLLVHIADKTFFFGKGNPTGLVKIDGLNYGKFELDPFNPTLPTSLSFKIPQLGSIELLPGKRSEVYYESSETNFSVIQEKVQSSLIKLNPVFNNYTRALNELFFEQKLNTQIAEKLRFAMFEKTGRIVLLLNHKGDERILVPNSSRISQKVLKLSQINFAREGKLLTLGDFVSLNKTKSIGFVRRSNYKEIQMDRMELTNILQKWVPRVLNRELDSESYELLTDSLFYKYMGVDYFFPSIKLGNEYFTANIVRLKDKFSSAEILNLYQTGVLGFIPISTLKTLAEALKKLDHSIAVENLEG